MTKAIATIVIGDVFKSMWFDGSLGDCASQYCRRHGYDLIVFDDYLDKSDFGLSRPPHWQKLLILESERLAGFDDVVWLDADILINHHRAPCIVSQKRTGKIGCVTLESTEMPTPAKRDNRWKRRNTAPVAQWYEHFGLGAEVDQWTNTGVLALTKAQFSFVADEAGEYAIACGFPAHAMSGHWLALNVSGTAKVPTLQLGEGKPKEAVK